MKLRGWNGWWIPDDTGMRDRTNPANTQGKEFGQINMVLEHCKARRVVVQGGARIGVWPRSLATVFERVIAFEPADDNFKCLELNTEEHENIEIHHAALGPMAGRSFLARSKLSGGEHYLALKGGGDPVRMMTIDSLELPICDAFFLDVEGYELEVLQGAVGTIERTRPTICLEENILVTRYGHNRGDVEAWLKPFGYSRVAEWTTLPPEIQNNGKFHGSDLIFAVP